MYLANYFILTIFAEKVKIITDPISVGGNAIASVRLSVRLFPLYLRNRLTADLEFLRVSRS